MSDDVNQSAAPSQDPLAAIADAMQAAAETVSQGATAACDAAGSTLPDVARFTNRFLYTACYGLSYGVVFPLALVALSVPQNNPFVHGLIDGSRAARNKVDDILGGKRPVEAPAA